jgi:hypothetical protein
MKFSVYTADGQDFGIYEAESAEGAVLACVNDAGYESVQEMLDATGDKECEILARDVTPNDGVELADWAAQGCHWHKSSAIGAAVRARAATLTPEAITALGVWADQQPDGIVTQTAITEYLIGDFEHLNGFMADEA